MRLDVLPEHRPTLSDALLPRLGPRGLRALAVLALVALAALAYARLRPADVGTVVVGRAGRVAFNLTYTEGLRRERARPPEVLRLVARRGELFVQGFTVEPLELRPYRGEPGGALPVEGAREIEVLRRRYREFELVQDGKTRVNEVVGYQILFRARLGERRLFGRQILLPEPVPGSRRGARLVLLATPAAGVAKAADVGVRGVIKRPYRTFRFGTERP